MNLAAPQLRWLGGDIERFKSFARGGRKELAEFLANRGSIHITYHDKREIVRNVAGFVIVQYVFPSELIVHIKIADHRMPKWTGGKDRVEHQLGALPTGIIKTHGKLAADDLLLFDVFLLGQRGILHGIRKDSHGIRGPTFWHIDPVNRAIKGRVGIDIASVVLNLLGNLPWWTLFRPFEKHVFKNV